MSKLQSARTFVQENLDLIVAGVVVVASTVGVIALVKSSSDYFAADLDRAEDYKNFLREFATAHPDAFAELTNAAIAITHK